MWAGGAWSHLQGAVSAALSILKPDIRKAVHEFVSCSAPAEEETDLPSRLSIRSSRGLSRGLSAVFGFPSERSRVADTSVIDTAEGEGPCDGEGGIKNNGNHDIVSVQFEESLEKSSDTGMNVISEKEPSNDEDCSNSQPVGENEIGHDDSNC
jgi:hypothetical protein